MRKILLRQIGRGWIADFQQPNQGLRGNRRSRLIDEFTQQLLGLVGTMVPNETKHDAGLVVARRGLA